MKHTKRDTFTEKRETETTQIQIAFRETTIRL
jgi:hypothetical protein